MTITKDKVTIVHYVDSTKILRQTWVKLFINNQYCTSDETYAFGKRLSERIHLNIDSPKYHQILTQMDEFELAYVTIYYEEVLQFDDELAFYLRSYPVEIIR